MGSDPKIIYQPDYGDVSNYPDDPALDADNLSGMVTKDDIKYIRGIGGIQYGYANFKPGTKRINATRDATAAALGDFTNHLKAQKKCCKCFEYFGVNKP